MPNWKKLVASGSNAHLNTLNVSTDITASGHISASGNLLIGTEIYTNGVKTLQRYANGNLEIGNLDDEAQQSHLGLYVGGAYSANAIYITSSNGYVGLSNENPTERLSVEGNISASGTMYATTVSASNFSGSYYGDGSNLTGISAGGLSVANSANNRIITSVDSSNGNAEASLTFDGSSLIVTGSTTLYRSGSVGDTDVLSIEGGLGNLFSITDELSGSLFSVNDISGLPVLEVFSDNTIKMGTFGAEALFIGDAISGSSVGVGHAPTYRFDVSGSARITDTLTVNTTVYTSATALKEQIASINKVKAKVIEFKEYQFKVGGGGRKRYGVLAEDIENDYPELVFTGPDGVKGVNYIDLLVKRVAELEKELLDMLPAVSTLSDTTNISWDSLNKAAVVTLGGNRVLDNPTNLINGHTYTLIVKQDATGNRTLTYGNVYKWSGGTAPTLTTTANAVDIFTFIYDGTSLTGNPGGSSGGGGGASNLTGLSDVTISSVQNNDLLMYNSVASKWQNTNLGISVTPTITGSSSVTAGISYTLTVSNHAVYDDPAYLLEAYSGSVAVVTGSAITDNLDGTLTFQAPVPGTYELRVRCQDFGDLQSEIATTALTTTPFGGTYRYWRMTGVTCGTNGNWWQVSNWRMFTGAGQSGTSYPASMTSDTAPSPYVVDVSYLYNSTYTAWKVFDSNTSSYYWAIGSNAGPDVTLDIDLGSAINVKSMTVKSGPSVSYLATGFTIYASSTGAFNGEEVFIHTETGIANVSNTVTNMG